MENIGKQRENPAGMFIYKKKKKYIYIYITCGWSLDETTYSSWLINRSEIEKPTTKRKKHALAWFSGE